MTCCKQINKQTRPRPRWKESKNTGMSLSDGIDAETLSRIKSQLAENLEEKRRRRKKYGYVRPIISGIVKGYRVVAIGTALHWSETWKTVPDFLSYYIKITLGPEWGTAEIQRSE